MVITTMDGLMGSTKSSNLFNEGDIRNKIITGTISTDMAPGAWVYNDTATELWIPLDAGTAAHLLAGPGSVGVVMYRPRIYTTTGALRLNTDDYDITYMKNAPICISGIVGANIVDLNADANSGTELIASATAESSTIQLQASTGHSSGTALTSRGIATLGANVVDGDTICIACLGQCMGDIWGGINE